MSVGCETDLPRDLPRGPISATSLTSPRSRRLRCTWRRRRRWRESSPSTVLFACRSSPISTTSPIERSTIAQLSHRSPDRPKLSIRAIAAAPIQRAMSTATPRSIRSTHGSPSAYPAQAFVAQPGAVLATHPDRPSAVAPLKRTSQARLRPLGPVDAGDVRDGSGDVALMRRGGR